MKDENPKFNISLIIASFIYFLLISWLHNIRWDFLFGKPLHPCVSYTIGLSGFILALGIWLKNLRVIVGAIIIAIAGGTADVLGYVLDTIGILSSNNRKYGGKQ